MVDPNRKINRLTDKDIEFLEECEQEFALRYTDKDAEFSEYIAKPLGDPPIVENWTFGGGGGGDDGRRNDGGGRNFNNRGGNRQRGNWHDNRGGGGGGERGQYNRNYRVRRGSRGGGGGDYGNRDGNRNRAANYRPYERRNNYGHRDQDHHQDASNVPARPPINVRRDYGNFVAASKDD